MPLQLVSDQLSLVLNRDYRNDVIENFKKIEQDSNNNAGLAEGLAGLKDNILVLVAIEEKSASNIKALIGILKEYDVPIGIDDTGTIVDLSKKEGD